jgi:flagellum-specific ATP synthase
MPSEWDLSSRERQFAAFSPLQPFGRIRRVSGPVVESDGPPCTLGTLCSIVSPRDSKVVPAEVVGFNGRTVYLMPLAESSNLGPEWQVYSQADGVRIPVGDWQLGRVLDALGEPLDGRGRPNDGERRNVQAAPPNALQRQRISSVMRTGIRAVDSLLTLGRGQRIGIFAGSGVGKSTLMGMVARGGRADVNVIGLIGERGREVRDFLEKDLGPEGMRRSVVVVATSDQPAVLRLKAAQTATAIAEHFRDQGKDVMLMMDSVTRYAVALREIGLAVGEPPTVRGYPPSMFAALPRLLERSGPAARGTITGIYTVLVDGGDFDEPVADAVRGILDGHWVLSRDLAHRNHYPAIDMLSSISRVMADIVPAEQLRQASAVRRALAVQREAEDLVSIGAYSKGSNPVLDKALAASSEIEKFLQQESTVSVDEAQASAALRQLAAKL